jgi:hypothetical protein
MKTIVYQISIFSLIATILISSTGIFRSIHVCTMKKSAESCSQNQDCCSCCSTEKNNNHHCNKKSAFKLLPDSNYNIKQSDCCYDKITFFKISENSTNTKKSKLITELIQHFYNNYINPLSCYSYFSAHQKINSALLYDSINLTPAQLCTFQI